MTRPAAFPGWLDAFFYLVVAVVSGLVAAASLVIALLLIYLWAR